MRQRVLIIGGTGFLGKHLAVATKDRIKVLNPARVAAMTSGRGDFGDIWSELIQQRQMYVSRVEPQKWYSVDTLEHLERCAERMGSPAA